MVFELADRPCMVRVGPCALAGINNKCACVTSARTWSSSPTMTKRLDNNARSVPHRRSHLDGDDISLPKTKREEDGEG